jgi:hypothetical protein
MQAARTFLAWGTCGSEGAWTIDEGRDYPRLQWEHRPGAPIRLSGLSGLLPGTGTEEDPFLVSTAQDLNWIGLFPCEWDKHFRLCADIDLSAFDCSGGGPAFNPIAPGRSSDLGYFLGASFTGVFDGNRHTLRHLTVAIRDGGCAGLFGGLGPGAVVRDLSVVDANVTSSGCGVGVLAGYNLGGCVTGCCSTGRVTGRSIAVGGLLGWNYGTVTRCYSTSSVRGEGYGGGLIGYNGGEVTDCYSAGAVGAAARAGGLVGCGGTVNRCLWDTEASGQAASGGGTGRDTARMHARQTFLDAGWDLLGETAHGTQDLWGISDGKDYPRFAWEFWASCPGPAHHAIDVTRTPTLSWLSSPEGAEHDVYFGQDEQAVSEATPQTAAVYQGRQSTATTTFSPGALAWGRTYYWRVDEVRQDDPRSPWKGGTWSFSAADSVVLAVVDDFEAYNDDWIAGSLLFDTWTEGGNALVGNWDPPEGPYAEQTIVHGARQSMPLAYDNTRQPWYSQAERIWDTPQDWTRGDPEALTLYVCGQAGNGPDSLYVTIQDCAGHVAELPHPDARAAQAAQWQRWDIPLADLRALGVDLASVKKMMIGVGNCSIPRPGGKGKITVDDIRLTRPLHAKLTE